MIYKYTNIFMNIIIQSKRINNISCFLFTLKNEINSINIKYLVKYILPKMIYRYFSI